MLKPESNPTDILLAPGTADLTCGIRAGVFQILDQSPDIDPKLVGRAESSLTKALGEIDFADDDIWKMVAATLAAELPRLLNLPDHTVKIVRSGKQDFADGAFIVRLIPKKENKSNE